MNEFERLPGLDEIEAARETVYRDLQASPQINWPLLDQRCGAAVWVKHENHLPTGSFKLRGGLLFAAQLQAATGVIAATRGNHGQSVAFAARRYGLPPTVVVPQGNNPDKNRAMIAYGAELIEHGADFNEAYEFAKTLADERNLTLFPSFHPTLVCGVATYALELFSAVGDLDTVYVPIGLGSGICGVIAARNALALRTRIVGVVASNADAYARSFANKRLCETRSADTLADGLAVRVPDPAALRFILEGAARVVAVSDEEILHAMSVYFSDTHNLAEGAGAAALAALLSERDAMRGKRVGLVLSGGNVDKETFARILDQPECN